MADRLVLLLQGVGEARATRLAEQVRSQPGDYRAALGRAIAEDHGPATCPSCGDDVGEEACPCEHDPSDPSVMMIVRSAKDAEAIRRAQWDGWVHVLRGLLDPDHGVGPAQLTTRALLARLRDDRITDVVMAVHASGRGQQTEEWLAGLLRPVVDQLWALGQGVQAGHDLEYAAAEDIVVAIRRRMPIR